MARDADDERPMNEAEWEEFFRRADFKADRYGELLETLIDDPQRDEKIAREMGWDPEEEGPAFADLPDEPDDDADAAAFDAEADDSLDDMDRSDRDAVPAYAAASDLGHRVADVLRPLQASADGGGSPADESDDEVVGRAFIGIQIAAAKLIGGHGMGYDDDALCGNIVCCKRALAAAVDGRAAWGDLRDRDLLPAPVADEIIAGHGTVIGEIEAWIADLRSRVHW